MTVSCHGVDQNPAADLIEKQASDWLQRRNVWNWSERDQVEFDVWLESSLANSLAFWRLKSAWDRAERLSALKLSNQPNIQSRTRTVRWPNKLRVAVGVALIAVSGIVTAQFLQTAPAVKTYMTTVGGHKTLVLSDGSSIELNTDTVLRIRANNSRRVWLEKGEAYFQIKHDDAHPFTVTAGKHRVRDIGTKFSIRRDIDHLRIGLIEGLALVEPTNKASVQKSVLLHPGDVAVASANSIAVDRGPVRDLTTTLGWRRGMIVFHHTTLADAAAEFNRYRHEKLRVSDPKAARLMMNGTFPVDDPEAFVRVTQQVFGLRARKDEAGIIISY